LTVPVASIAFARGGPESGPNLRSWSNRQRAEVNGEPSSLHSLRFYDLIQVLNYDSLLI